MLDYFGSIIGANERKADKDLEFIECNKFLASLMQDDSEECDVQELETTDDLTRATIKNQRADHHEEFYVLIDMAV